MSKYGLGYLQLNRDEKILYEKVETALRRYENNIDVSGSADFAGILSVVLGDNPDIVHLQHPKCVIVGLQRHKRATISGTVNKSLSRKMEDELKKKVEDILWEVDKNARSDRDILMGVSEYFQRTIRYDYYDDIANATHPNAHNAYGALVQNMAVCEGIAKAYSLVLAGFGMRSMVVSGNTNGESAAQETHAWNIVEFENDFYHCDITWDLNGYIDRQIYSYQYFGLNDSEISSDHTWNLRRTPKCKGDRLSYYKYNHLYAYSYDQISKLVRMQYSQGLDVLRVRMDDKLSFPENVCQFMEDRVADGLGLCGFKYYWDDQTRCLTVTDIIE